MNGCVRSCYRVSMMQTGPKPIGKNAQVDHLVAGKKERQVLYGSVFDMRRRSQTRHTKVRKMRNNSRSRFRANATTNPTNTVRTTTATRTTRSSAPLQKMLDTNSRKSRTNSHRKHGHNRLGEKCRPNAVLVFPGLDLFSLRKVWAKELDLSLVWEKK